MRSQEVYGNRQNFVAIIVVTATTSIIVIYSMYPQEISSLAFQGFPFSFLISS